MTSLKSKYLIAKYVENRNLLNRYRLAKSENEIDAKIFNSKQHTFYKSPRNLLSSLRVRMPFPELREKQFNLPNVDIYDEERNRKMTKHFLELAELEVFKHNQKNLIKVKNEG